MDKWLLAPFKPFLFDCHFRPNFFWNLGVHLNRLFSYSLLPPFLPLAPAWLCCIAPLLHRTIMVMLHCTIVAPHHHDHVAPHKDHVSNMGIMLRRTIVALHHCCVAPFHIMRLHTIMRNGGLRLNGIPAFEPLGRAMVLGPHKA